MDWTVEEFGPDAWLVRFGRVLSEDMMARALSVSRCLDRDPPPGLREFTMGYASVLLEFDGPRPEAQSLIGHLRGEPPEASARAGRLLKIPVVYDGEDLEEVSVRAGLTRDEVIRRHTGRDYRVWLLGFSPGFPYLGILDESLHLPRRGTPRARVAAGSVAIAGAQTGIYPTESAGGWHVIGRTPLRMFDADRPDEPFLLKPGDAARFVAVEADDV